MMGLRMLLRGLHDEFRSPYRYEGDAAGKVNLVTLRAGTHLHRVLEKGHEVGGCEWAVGQRVERTEWGVADGDDGAPAIGGARGVCTGRERLEGNSVKAEREDRR